MTDPSAPGPEAPGHEGAVHWLADYVYGTIATLVAIAGLTFESNPGELTTAGVVIVGAVAIWFAHTLSRLVVRRSRGPGGPLRGGGGAAGGGGGGRPAAPAGRGRPPVNGQGVIGDVGPNGGE